MTLNLLVIAVVVTSSLLFHELGHLLGALALGCRIDGFYFWRGGLVGGPRVAVWTMQRREAEFWVALAGPGMNILLAQCIVLAGCSEWTWANWIVAGIALAPLHGSDGRRAWAAFRASGGVRVAGNSPSPWFRCFLRDSGAKSFRYLFGCRHQNLAWPRTRRYPGVTVSSQNCLDCGAKLDYSGPLCTK